MKKYRVLITDGLDPVGIDLLKTHPEIGFELHESLTTAEIKKIIPGHAILIVKNARIDASVFESGRDLKLIVHTGSNALDSIDIEAAKKNRVAVLSSGNSGALSVAEHTLSLLLLLARSSLSVSNQLKQGVWPNSLSGVELHSKVLGVFGLGNIGKIVAEKAMALGMQVIAFDPLYPSISLLPNKFKMLETRFTLARTPDEVYKHADFLTLHISHSKNSPPLIDEEALSKMKSGVYLLNLSSSDVMSADATIEALQSGRVAGLGIDLETESDFKKMKTLIQNNNVIATANQGGATRDARERIAAAAAEQVLAFVNSGLKLETLN